MAFCVFGLTTNAQTATKTAEKVDLSTYLQKMKNLDTQEQSLLAEPLTDKVADRLEIINAKRAELTKNSGLQKKMATINKNSQANSQLKKASELNAKFIAEKKSVRASVVDVKGEMHIQLVNTSDNSSTLKTPKK